MDLTSVTVFCGSSPGADPTHMATAEALGRGLAAAGLRLVYGGAHVGCMGALADGALRAGGEATGVMTAGLVEAEIAHRGLTTLEVVATMHERKARMADLGDAFVMLPGGFGTLDEFCEALTWTQLGIHAKPCAVLDPTGFYGPFLELLDRAVEQRFVRPEHRALVHVAASVDELLAGLPGWRPTHGDKWLDRLDR